MSDHEVIVLGGGLAGIAAAVRLAKHGMRSAVVEKRPFLGGRAFSFNDRSCGEEIDNGQHVILGSCDQFLELLDQLGTRHLIDVEKRLRFAVWWDGRRSMLEAGRLTGNVGALLRYDMLSWADRLSVMRCLLRIKLSYGSGIDFRTLSNLNFADWLRANGQSVAAVEAFWSLVILPVFNCRIDEVAAEDVVDFIQLVLLGRASDAALGIPKSGLSTLIGNPGKEWMDNNGVELLTNTDVAEMRLVEEHRYEVRTASGEKLKADCVISCLPPDALQGILPSEDALYDHIREVAASFEFSPIVAVHLWFERAFMREKVAAFVDRRLQWVFNDDSRRIGTADHHIVVSLSAADEWVDVPKGEIVEQVVDALLTAFPEARNIRLTNSAVVKTPQATIKLVPESNNQRTQVFPGLEGLFVAGDWTMRGLPATMEGAVKSGMIAAELATHHLRSK